MHIFVTNFGKSATEETLEDLFDPYAGTAYYADVDIWELQGTKAERFAIVEIRNEENARKAIKKMDGRKYHGRTLTVLEAPESFLQLLWYCHVAPMFPLEYRPFLGGYHPSR